MRKSDLVVERLKDSGKRVIHFYEIYQVGKDDVSHIVFRTFDYFAAIRVQTDLRKVDFIKTTFMIKQYVHL